MRNKHLLVKVVDHALSALDQPLFVIAIHTDIMIGHQSATLSSWAVVPVTFAALNPELAEDQRPFIHSLGS